MFEFSSCNAPSKKRVESFINEQNAHVKKVIIDDIEYVTLYWMSSRGIGQDDNISVTFRPFGSGIYINSFHGLTEFEVTDLMLGGNLKEDFHGFKIVKN